MRTRTRLTSPPGYEPEGAPLGPSRVREWYSPGFRIPDEPRPPSRLRLGSVVVLLVVLLAAAGFAVVSVAGGEAEDPSLTPPTNVPSP